MRTMQIKGAIVNNDNKWVYDYLETESTAPSDVSNFLREANGEDVVFEINSGGGDIFAGSEIYTNIRKYSGNVEIHIVGIAASAASVIAMAGKSKIAPTGMMMIHNVSTSASGDCNVMQHEAEVLKIANQSVANAYKDKTGINDAELLELMDKETWLSAEEAVKKGFVDDVLFNVDEKPILINGFNNLNIEKLKNIIPKPKTKVNKESELLNLLELEGGFINGI